MIFRDLIFSNYFLCFSRFLLFLLLHGSHAIFFLIFEGSQWDLVDLLKKKWASCLSFPVYLCTVWIIHLKCKPEYWVLMGHSLWSVTEWWISWDGGKYAVNRRDREKGSGGWGGEGGRERDLLISLFFFSPYLLLTFLSKVFK